MTTSGTIGATPIDVATIIDHSFRRCGKLASTVSGELLLSARESLYFLLSGLANRGLSLWCQQKTPLALYPGREVYTLPTGTVDLLRVSHRTDTVIPGAPLTNLQYQGADLAYQHKVSTVSAVFQNPQVAQTFLVESSNDQIVWQGIAVWTLTCDAGDINFLDLDGAKAAQYWRLRVASGNLPVLTALAWHELPTELPVDRMNRDEYQGLPNRLSVGQRVLSFWFDKQIATRVYVWPVPLDDTAQLLVWTQRHIQDPGALSGTLDIPQRWQESIITSLAVRNALEIPPEELPPGRLEYLTAMAQEQLQLAEDGETDGARIRLMPNIRGYTR